MPTKTPDKLSAEQKRRLTSGIERFKTALSEEKILKLLSARGKAVDSL